MSETELEGTIRRLKLRAGGCKLIDEIDGRFCRDDLLSAVEWLEELAKVARALTAPVQNIFQRRKPNTERFSTDEWIS